MLMVSYTVVLHMVWWQEGEGDEDEREGEQDEHQADRAGIHP
jgi:hypothetical protein